MSFSTSRACIIVVIHAFNSAVVSQVKELPRLRTLRVMLCRMRSYVRSCPSEGKLVRLLAPRTYYMETAEMWSLFDLMKVRYAVFVLQRAFLPARAYTTLLQSVYCIDCSLALAILHACMHVALCHRSIAQTRYLRWPARVAAGQLPLAVSPGP
jgi:hypothetical protein